MSEALDHEERVQTETSSVSAAPLSGKTCPTLSRDSAVHSSMWGLDAIPFMAQEGVRCSHLCTMLYYKYQVVFTDKEMIN